MEFSIQPNLTVEGDPNLLHIALENLFENAWKFTSQTSLAVIKFGKLPPDPGESAAIKEIDELIYFLSDNGAGFDMAFSEKLFQPFERLHRLEEFDGTGIGLANVKRIIDLHGGKIWAKSEINNGATFFFTLPEKILGLN